MDNRDNNSEKRPSAAVGFLPGAQVFAAQRHEDDGRLQTITTLLSLGIIDRLYFPATLCAAQTAS